MDTANNKCTFSTGFVNKSYISYTDVINALERISDA